MGSYFPAIPAFVLASLFLMALPLSAQEPHHYFAYNDFLEEPGSSAVAFHSTGDAPHRAGDFRADLPELKYGVTGRWTTELYLDGQGTFGDSTVFTGHFQVNRFRPLKREYWIYPARDVEFKDAYGVDKSMPEVVDHDVEAEKKQQNAPAVAGPESKEGGIADNSFLVEEAYNQEYGVVQHIQTWTKMWVGNGWAYSFTQEWPVNFAPKNQLSYTFQALHSDPGTGSGVGDLILNYRYQVIQKKKLAFAPRFSVLVPSGDYRLGRGAGGWGWQTNLAVSWEWHPKLVTHWNLGATHMLHAKDPLGNQATVWGYNAGQSFIFMPSKRFNLMLESVFNSTEAVEGPGMTGRVNNILISPGFRWAHNLKNGTQIVPGFGFPIGVGPSRGEYGLVVYFSVEHPFARARGK